MPGFDELVDQERPVRLIKTALATGNIPHAFLFTGIRGTGKKSAALALAMACNCAKEHALFANPIAAQKSSEIPKYTTAPCGACRSCLKIAAGVHPDIHLVTPEGAYVKVEQIRSLCRRLALKPNEARIRLALIDQAHLMNPEAGNTLLKTLEEPPDSTIFVLTAPQTSDLLPTIVSRCRHIRFNPISTEKLSDFIRQKYGFHKTAADLMAAMAGGSFTQAAAMAESNWIQKRDWLIRQIEFLSQHSIRYALAFSETLSKNKKWLTDALDMMKIWYRDHLMAEISPAHVIHKDVWEKNQCAPARPSMDDVMRKIEAIEQAQQKIQLHANPRIILDALVLTLFGEKKTNGTCHRRQI